MGTIYRSSQNLWVPIIIHSLLDISAIPYCFTSNIRYANVTLIILIITYLALGCYSFVLLTKEKVGKGKQRT